MNEEYLLSFRVHKVFKNGITFVNPSYDTATLYFSGFSEKPGWVMGKNGIPVTINHLQAKIFTGILAKHVEAATSLLRAGVRSA